ncbi:hypothetical protein Z947_1572 [Sulfitobacter geojensis]|nr:hypothetical protein Z947_1572 [Sulfitobacter geojensis]
MTLAARAVVTPTASMRAAIRPEPVERAAIIAVVLKCFRQRWSFMVP